MLRTQPRVVQGCSAPNLGWVRGCSAPNLGFRVIFLIAHIAYGLVRATLAGRVG